MGSATAPSPPLLLALCAQGQLLGQLCNEVLTRRAARQYDEESLALAARLLELNPEVYTAWNFRREALEPLLAAGGALRAATHLLLLLLFVARGSKAEAFLKVPSGEQRWACFLFLLTRPLLPASSPPGVSPQARQPWPPSPAS